MAWIIADRRHSPALRSLQLSAEKGATIPVGCRRMHPDFTHLEHLSITRDIFLCINFICHLLPLRCCLAPQLLLKCLIYYPERRQETCTPCAYIICVYQDHFTQWRNGSARAQCLLMLLYNLIGLHACLIQ